MKEFDWGIEKYSEFIHSVGIGVFTGIIAGISIQFNNPGNTKINWILLVSSLLLILIKKWVEEKNIIAIIVSLLSLSAIAYSLFEYIKI